MLALCLLIGQEASIHTVDVIIADPSGAGLVLTTALNFRFNELRVECHSRYTNPNSYLMLGSPEDKYLRKERVFLKENQEGWNLERSPGLVEQTNGRDEVAWTNKSSEGAGENSSVKLKPEGLFLKGWGLEFWRNKLIRAKYGPLLLLRRLPEDSAVSTCGPYQAARGADSSHNCCPVS